MQSCSSSQLLTRVSLVLPLIAIESKGKFTQLLKPARKEDKMHNKEEERGTFDSHHLKKENKEKDDLINSLKANIL